MYVHTSTILQPEAKYTQTVKKCGVFDTLIAYAEAIWQLA